MKRNVSLNKNLSRLGEAGFRKWYDSHKQYHDVIKFDDAFAQVFGKRPEKKPEKKPDKVGDE